MKFLSYVLSTLSLVSVVSIATAADSSPPTPVIVTVVETAEYADRIEALGTLKANESVDLTSAVTEIVTKVMFEDNQKVQQGDVLIEMDVAEEMAELAEQESFINEAQRQVTRLTPLVEKGAASTSVLDENRRDLESAEARVNAIQSRINQRVIKAPFDGVLGLRNISIGSLAQPGTTITTIDDVSVMKLDFSVPEVFLASLKPGVLIEAETEAYPNETFAGKIAFVDSRIDPITRSIQARALIPNQNELLKPGLLMQVELQKNPRRAILIPEEALLANGPDNFVFVVSEVDGQYLSQRRKVELGSRQFAKAEIVNGLEPGEQIVTHGVLRVRDGGPVSVTAVEKNGEPLAELLEQKAASDRAKAEKADQ